MRSEHLTLPFSFVLYCKFILIILIAALPLLYRYCLFYPKFPALSTFFGKFIVFSQYFVSFFSYTTLYCTFFTLCLLFPQFCHLFPTISDIRRSSPQPTAAETLIHQRFFTVSRARRMTLSMS